MPHNEIKTRLVHAALALASEQGWALTTLRDIAREAEISLSDLSAYASDKPDILALLGKQIDRKVLDKTHDFSPETPPRDRLFDILMERFDVLNESRGGIIAVLESFKCDPKQALLACPHLARSMNWMLEAAHIDTNGPKGALKIMGLTLIYLNTLRVWKDDDSPDMGKTMSALDKALGKAEQAANTLGF